MRFQRLTTNIFRLLKVKRTLANGLNRLAIHCLDQRDPFRHAFPMNHHLIRRTLPRIPIPYFHIGFRDEMVRLGLSVAWMRSVITACGKFISSGCLSSGLSVFTAVLLADSHGSARSVETFNPVSTRIHHWIYSTLFQITFWLPLGSRFDSIVISTF